MFDLNKIETLFAGVKPQTVKLAELILDAGTQQRSKTNKDAIENYSEAMADAGNTKKFPAIHVVRLNHSHEMPDGSEIEAGALVLVDGFHRVEAADIAKLDEFKAFIADGSLEDAIYYSMQANSTNGVNLVGKDYQKAIRKLYSMDKYWQQHGRKQEIAKLFGCSTKTVQRATAAIDKEIKAEAFKMFEAGASDKDVAAFAVKDAQTIAKWRTEYEEMQAKKSNGGSNDEDEPQKEKKGKQEKQKDPMDLTFAEVLQLKDTVLKAKLLKLLMDSMASQSHTEDTKQEDEQPQQEDKKTAQDEPQDEDGAPWEDEQQSMGESEEMQDLFKEWENKDCWTILGKTRAQLDAMANPKAALKRAYNKALKRCHPDTKGANRALELLTAAFAEAKRYYK